MATIVVFAAHNDDHALAMGGTIAKHFKQGDSVYTFIGSFGELSHPHIRPDLIRRIRVKEAQRADRALGGDGRVQFLGLREFKFQEDFVRKDYHKMLARKLRDLKPSRIYMPAPDDTHADHKMVGTLVLQTLRNMRINVEVYAYYVYPHLRHMQAPRLYVDVSDVYRRKLDAIRAFRSQIKMVTYLLTNNIVFGYTVIWNSFTGIAHKTRFVETFYKLR